MINKSSTNEFELKELIKQAIKENSTTIQETDSDLYSDPELGAVIVHF